MSLLTYSDLQSKVADYLSRSDLTSQIVDFIYLAEVRLRRDLRIRQQLSIMTTATVAGTSTIAIPDDYNMMRDIHIVQNPVGTLEYKSPSTFYADSATQQGGQPRQYTIISNQFVFAPIPDSAYTISMLYYALPPLLSVSNTTNVFLQEAPDLLLYASLGEAAPFLMDDARLGVWANLYQKGLDALSVSDDEGEYSGAPLSVSVSPR